MAHSLKHSERIDIVPLTVAAANRYVESLHRHHGKMPAGFAWFGLGAVCKERIVGVAIVGRPTGRNADDGQSLEVQRVATDGTPNACSALLGACARVARALGAWRIITYTLEDESGASLRGAGWRREADGIATCWSNRKNIVVRDHMQKTKVRWSVQLRPAPLAMSDSMAEIVRPSRG